MNSKLGRNEPCPCGSGKKYKNCCGPAGSSFAFSEVSDPEWRKLRDLERSVIDEHLSPYALQLPKSIIDTAIADCMPEDAADALDLELLFGQLFLPWILFNWVPDKKFKPNGYNAKLTVAENYLCHHRDQLNPDELNFIEAMNKTFYSFYSVLEVVKNQSLLVKDLLLGETYRIKERAATEFLKRGSIVYSRVLTLNNQSIFVGMAPYTLPHGYHSYFIDFKNWLMKENANKPLTGELLRNKFAWIIYDYYLDALIARFNQPLPQLVNTDNEKIQFCASHFKLDLAPEITLKHLMPMTLSKDPEEFLYDAKRNKAGLVIEIYMPWMKKGNKAHKDWDNTILGEITIKESKLILRTNSLERAEKGKALIKKLLKEAIIFQQTLIETPEQKLQSPNVYENQPDDEKNLLENPEVKKQIQAMAQSHWLAWFDTPIPALKNKTPRQAAKTKEGRERLEALLSDYEYSDQTKPDNDPFKADIAFLKKELGLGK